jgi:sigma-B regulation protein RsbU (phosphoserine phosphatase)
MFCAGNYVVESIRLGAGDSLVFYTDGLTESLDGANNEYGLHHLAQFLKGRHALEEIKQFSNGAPQRDDRTILVLRRS